MWPPKVPSGMTPLQHAASILKSLEAITAAVALPEPRVVGVAGAVISCEETRVSLANVTLVPNAENAWACDVAESATYLVAIARNCAWTSNDDGTEDYEALAAVTALVDSDVVALGELFRSLQSGDVPVINAPAVGWGQERTGVISVELTGGLAISTLTMTVGVP